jgi:hypothetical protein
VPVDHARKSAIRQHMAAAGLPYSAAAHSLEEPFRPGLISIAECMADQDRTYAEAVDFLSDPGNRTMCETCGWTNYMVCPECPGCGCYNLRCSGWRHEEAMTDDELEELRQDDRCEECGADHGYGCNC